MLARKVPGAPNRKRGVHGYADCTVIDIPVDVPDGKYIVHFDGQTATARNPFAFNGCLDLRFRRPRPLIAETEFSSLVQNGIWCLSGRIESCHSEVGQVLCANILDRVKSERPGTSQISSCKWRCRSEWTSGFGLSQVRAIASEIPETKLYEVLERR